MKVLYLDCFSGISGDMTVGALCDLGVKPSALEWELSKLDLGDFHMHFERKQRQQIEGVHFSIHEGATHLHDPEEKSHEHSHSHGHSHTHGHHEHTHEHSHSEDCGHSHGRNHAEIRALISQSDLSEFVKKHALSIFNRIAVAEGKIHGMPPENVQFHEVGALDSIADVVCACAGIEQLGIEKVFVSKLQDGCGWIHTAHGRFPVPAPATLEILKDIPVSQMDEPFEFITPTGAAIVAEFGATFGAMPQMRIEKIGYGIGTRVTPNRPNVLRALLGELAEDTQNGGYDSDTITRIETNIDDLTPEILGLVMEKLFSAGALDCFFTPVQMKKNRPATQLTVLCENKTVGLVTEILFKETSSFGIRMDEVTRLKLQRRMDMVETPFGKISVKIGLRGDDVLQKSPEFESCRLIAEKSGQPLRVIYQAAFDAMRELPEQRQDRV
jgi:pyridinium-3,5-bisthiocarboxylic acid mononucleotide nickel chelatase